VAEFLIRIYFDLSEDYMTGAIKRAYRDMNRTMREFAKDKDKENDRENLRIEWRKALISQIQNLLDKEVFDEQNQFDQWHKETCEKLMAINELHKFTYGQAQKWVNMSLKYLYVMGDVRVPNIKRNYRFFHIPIDNYIIEGFFKKSDKKINKIVGAWSKLDYENYIKYQCQLREDCNPRILMDVEFEMFNKELFPNT
jgi:hypothetical protein